MVKKKKRSKRQTMVVYTLHRSLKIEHYENPIKTAFRTAPPQIK